MRFAIWYQSDKKPTIIHQNVVAILRLNERRLSYGFEEHIFPDDIALCKDTSHDYPYINTKINEAIASVTHIITAGNVDKYLQKA